MKVISLTGNEG